MPTALTSALVALKPPFQLGRTERQGGILKDILKSVIQDKQVIGVEEIKIRWSSLKLSRSRTTVSLAGYQEKFALWQLTIHDDDLEHLGVHQGIEDPLDEFSRQLQIRQAAKQAFVQADSSRRIRTALLRKSTPLRGPYKVGDLVSFHRKGRWFGPGNLWPCNRRLRESDPSSYKI